MGHSLTLFPGCTLLGLPLPHSDPTGLCCQILISYFLPFKSYAATTLPYSLAYHGLHCWILTPSKPSTRSTTPRNTHPLSAPLGLPHNPWLLCGPGQSRTPRGAAASWSLLCGISSAPGPALLATSAAFAGLQAPWAARVPGPPPCSVVAAAQGAMGARTRAWPWWPVSRVLGPAAPAAGAQVSRTRSPSAA